MDRPAPHPVRSAARPSRCPAWAASPRSAEMRRRPRRGGQRGARPSPARERRCPLFGAITLRCSALSSRRRWPAFVGPALAGSALAGSTFHLLGSAFAGSARRKSSGALGVGHAARQFPHQPREVVLSGIVREEETAREALSSSRAAHSLGSEAHGRDRADPAVRGPREPSPGRVTSPRSRCSAGRCPLREGPAPGKDGTGRVRPRRDAAPGPAWHAHHPPAERLAAHPRCALPSGARLGAPSGAAAGWVASAIRAGG